ncbi:MAG: hypothetical protein D6719_08275 [Candidatus Dadabacteria bacterium]|nr:MAG: hypothetical protein D6719_08275 [Candidatus Dadabacteria bacterium]
MVMRDLKRLPLYLFATALASSFCASWVSAQSSNVNVKRGPDGRVAVIEFNNNTAATRSPQAAAPSSAQDFSQIALATIKNYAALLGLSDVSTLAETRHKSDMGEHYSYTQQVNGIPVVPTFVNVHLRPDGRPYLITSSAVKPSGLKWKAARVKRQFIQRQFNKRGRRRFRLPGRLRAVKRAALNAARRDAPPELLEFKIKSIKPELFAEGIFNQRPDDNVIPAYEIKVVDRITSGELFSSSYTVNKKAEILNTVPDIKHAGLDRWVYDCTFDAGTQSVPCALDDPDPVFIPYIHGRSEGMPARGGLPDPSDPAHFGQTDVDDIYDYLLPAYNITVNQFGIDGPNNQGGTGRGGNPPGSTRAFAFLEVSFPSSCPYQSVYNMNSGGINFCNEAAVPDTVGHEYAHAISTTAMGGTGTNTQMQTVEETFSDFFGEAVEREILGTIDWQDGTNTGYPYPRDHKNPRLAESELIGFMHPAVHYDYHYYCGPLDNGGIHLNATALGHALYMFINGGFYNGCDIPGGNDILDALKIFYRGFSVYFTTSSQYVQIVAGLNSACNDLYPANVCSGLATALEASELSQPGMCSSTPEAQPACAYNHLGNLKTTFQYGNAPATVFAPGEQLWLKGSGSAPNLPSNIYFVASNPTWTTGDRFVPDTSTWITTITSDPFGNTFGYVTTPDQTGFYDVIVDGNQDGSYEPWNDKVLTVEVRNPVDGDGLCYRGFAPGLREDCHSAPIDCGCGAGNYCSNVACEDGGYTPPLWVCTKSPAPKVRVCLSGEPDKDSNWWGLK